MKHSTIKKKLAKMDRGVATYLFRYGTITADYRWSPNSAPVESNYRATRIEYNGIEYSLEFKDGELSCVGWNT